MTNNYFIGVDYSRGIIKCNTISEAITISKSLDRHFFSKRIVIYVESGIYSMLGPFINGHVEFIRLYPDPKFNCKEWIEYEERRWKSVFTSR